MLVLVVGLLLLKFLVCVLVSWIVWIYMWWGVFCGLLLEVVGCWPVCAFVVWLLVFWLLVGEVPILTFEACCIIDCCDTGFGCAWC